MLRRPTSVQSPARRLSSSTASGHYRSYDIDSLKQAARTARALAAVAA
jgi:hypothetical protein